MTLVGDVAKVSIRAELIGPWMITDSTALETPGEDVLHVQNYIRNFVPALQGDDLANKQVIATCKVSRLFLTIESAVQSLTTLALRCLRPRDRTIRQQLQPHAARSRRLLPRTVQDVHPRSSRWLRHVLIQQRSRHSNMC